MTFNSRKIFSKKIIFRSKIMREIDCAHRKSVKKLLWPWFREANKFFRFLLCAKKLGSKRDSNQRPLWPISRCFVTAPPKLVDGERSFKPSTSIKKVEKIYIFPESGSGKLFRASAMRTIDFSHDFTPKNDLVRKFFSWISP